MKFKQLTALALFALVTGCTTVEEVPNVDHFKTTTEVAGVEVKGVAYQCHAPSKQDNSEFKGQFDVPFLIEFTGQDSALLVVREGSYPLLRTRSGSGAKYESLDGKQMFWGKGNQATITFDGETFTDCSVVK